MAGIHSIIEERHLDALAAQPLDAVSFAGARRIEVLQDIGIDLGSRLVVLGDER